MPANATVPAATPPAPLVSVVVPTYRRGAAILRTLESVFAQSFSDYELIVVDDGSPDDTIERMRPLADAGRIRLVVQANAGTAAARNRGLAEARGEFIAFLDHDDLWPKDKLAWQVAFLRDHPEVDLVGGLLETMDEHERPGETQYSFEPGPFDFERLFRGNPLCSPGQWVARTETVRRLNGFNPQFWGTDDYDFLLRATRLARVVGVHRLALHYREHAASVSRNGPRMLRNSLAVARTQFGYVPAERRRATERLFYRFLYRAIGRPMLVRAWGDLRARHFARGLAAAGAGVRFFVWPALRDLPWFFSIVFEGVWSRLSGGRDGKAVARPERAVPTMKAPPSLLVLTPTLGTSRYLEASLASVSDLGLSSVHHLLVCPTNRVTELGERFPGRTVVADAGRAGGLYGALNAGLAAADTLGLTWDWFTYINDDDLLSPGFAELVHQHCRPECLASVAYGDILNIDPSDRPLGRMTVERRREWLPRLLQAGISPVGQQGMVFGAPVVRALGGYSREYRLCADLDFWARAHAQGFPFQYYPLEVGRFRIQPGQLSGDVELTRREQADITARQFPGRLSPIARRLVQGRYRLANLPRYLERRRALGGRLSTSDAMLAGAATADSPRT